MRDPDYLASERRKSQLAALREGRAGPQYIFITLDTEIIQAMGPSGETHVAAAEALLSALLAHQSPLYEQIVTASEAYKAWQAHQDPQAIYVYVLRQVAIFWQERNYIGQLAHRRMGFQPSIGGTFNRGHNGISLLLLQVALLLRVIIIMARFQSTLRLRHHKHIQMSCTTSYGQMAPKGWSRCSPQQAVTLTSHDTLIHRP